MRQGNDFDVVVVGAGLVGAAFSLAMVGSGLRIGLLEAAPPQELPQDESWDSRIYTVSPGNAAFLERLGIWTSLDRKRLAPIHNMQIWGDDGRSAIEFDAYAAGAESLGWVVESRQMQSALWRALEACEDVTVLCPGLCESLSVTDEIASLAMNDGRTLLTQLVVAADGGNSLTRHQAGIAVVGRDYGQMGVVANFVAEKPHGNVARQWFRQDSILAWLPLPGNRISMVWSTLQSQAEKLLALDSSTLCEQVAEAGHNTLGKLQLVTSATGFPLRLQSAATMVIPRLALIGDAAHLVHPLAGQGVNLGFRDAACLSGVLFQRGVRDYPGDYLLLRRYERARKMDILSMQAVTDGLQLLFNNDRPWCATLRNTGLKLTDSQGWLKRRLMARALA